MNKTDYDPNASTQCEVSTQDWQKAKVAPTYNYVVQEWQKCTKCGKELAVPYDIYGRTICEDCVAERVTTIADEKQEDRITRVAIILKEFLKLANSKEYWDSERSGRGWVRMWARKIVQAM